MSIDLSRMASALLAVHAEVTKDIESGDFMIGFLLGLLIGTRAPKGAGAFLVAYLDASDENQQRTFSRLADAILNEAAEPSQ